MYLQYNNKKEGWSGRKRSMCPDVYAFHSLRFNNLFVICEGLRQLSCVI